MVLMTGSKMARYQGTLVNRGNCGGNKKTGLARGIGIHNVRHILARTISTAPRVCDTSLGPRQVHRMHMIH
jgi:hypothetical protein